MLNKLASGIWGVGPSDREVMQNFRLDDFLLVNRKISELRQYMSSQREQTIKTLDVKDMDRVFSWLENQLYALRLDAISHIHTIKELLKKPDDHCSIISHYLDETMRSIDDQIRTEWTHHYGVRTANISEAHIRWSNVLRAFPSTEFEIASALDCFALEHYTASVFHFMRLAEHGLRALAIELSVTLPKDKPLTHANWNDIINHCEKRVKEIEATAPAGDEKDKALAFYATALAHLHALKNKYRNCVMHARETFNNNGAVDASHVTKSLMDLLTTKLSERKKKKGFTPEGKIDWGFPAKR